jgi:hypothetical protein
MTFYYDAPINDKLDERLKELGKTMGFEWYGQGQTLFMPNNRRDISFNADFGGFEDEDDG